MNDPLDRLEQITDAIELKQKFFESGRNYLLYIHAGISITSGLAILLTGLPKSFRYVVDPHGFELFMGLLALTGGSLILSGLLYCSTHHFFYYITLVGLSVSAVWYLCIVIEFFSTFFTGRPGTLFFVPIFLGMIFGIVTHTRNLIIFIRNNLV